MRFINTVKIPKINWRALRHGQISFRMIANLFIISLLIIPSYFGIRIGFFDLTALRVIEILLYFSIFSSGRKRQEFISLLKHCKHIVWIALYAVIVIYTNLFHLSLNTIFYWFTNVFMVLFAVMYLLRYEYSPEQFLSLIYKCLLFVCLLSPLELVIGKSPFLYLNTLGKEVGSVQRFDAMRIKGPCWETNSYGLYLMIFFPFICYDVRQKKIDLCSQPLLLVLFIVNIFLTGARLAIGQLALSVFLILILSGKKEVKKALLFAGVFMPAVLLFLIIFRDGMAQGIWRTIFSAVDFIFNTDYSVRFGAQADILEDSAYYRELLFNNTILKNWPDPLLGRGGAFNFHLYIEGYDIKSIDNFYVAQYVTYAWPGLIAWIFMSVSYFTDSVKKAVKNINLAKLFAICWICYFIGLWYLDQLQTFPLMMIFFALEDSITEKSKRSTLFEKYDSSLAE